MMFETALATRQDDASTLGSLDVTPTFSVDLPGGVATAFPMGSYSWSAGGANRSRALEFSATSVATFRQLAAYLNRVFEAINQTLIQSETQIWVVPVSARPAEVIGDFHFSGPSIAERPSPAETALTAVSDIQRWLAVGQDQVANLAGYAPRSLKNWREGMDPYPSTVRRLLDLHALLGSLTHSMGVEGARLWLADAGQTGAQRRDRLADDAGLRSVISEASAILFERPTVPSMQALDFDEAESEVFRRPDVFSGPVRRARRRA